MKDDQNFCICWRALFSQGRFVVCVTLKVREPAKGRLFIYVSAYAGETLFKEICESFLLTSKISIS